MRWKLSTWGFFLLFVLVFIAGFFQGILFTGWVIRNFENQDDIILDSVTASPDKSYTAVAYTNMGGGAAGYCYTYVSVLPKTEFDNFQKAICKWQMYRQCSSIMDRHKTS